MTGVTLLEEGKPVEKAYVIKEGECIMISKRAPIKICNVDEFGRPSPDADKITLTKSRSGYFSKTLNTMQIGII